MNSTKISDLNPDPFILFLLSQLGSSFPHSDWFINQGPFPLLNRAF